MNSTRRNILKTLGATATTAILAGCSTDSSEDQTPNTGTKNGSTNSYDTEVSFTGLDNLEILPFVNEGNIDSSTELNVEVKDQDGLEAVQLTYNDSHREKPFTIYGQESNGETVSITGEFPQRLLSPRTGEFTVKATDTTGNTETKTQQINLNPNGWIVDRENGQYQTKRNWDNHQLNRQQLQENHINGWNEVATYNKVLEELEQGNTEKYDGEQEALFYSNSEYKNGNAEGYGHWDEEFYSELTDLEHIIGDPRSIIRTHQRDVHPTAYSAWANRASATMEKIIHEFNDEAKQHLEETGDKAVNVGCVFEGGHGTMIAYADTENTDIEAKHPWQFVDTTANGMAPVTEEINTRGGYNPFVEGFEPENYEGLEYESKKRKASEALGSFIFGGRGEVYEIQGQVLDFSDPILEDVFNNHIPKGGSIDPILEMTERGADLLVDTEYNVQMYGESLEDYETTVTKDQKLYEMSRDPGTTVTEQTIENYLTDLPA